MPAVIEMVFFDIGGVMYDDTVYARSWRTALRESGGEFTDEEFESEYTATRAAQAGSFRVRLTERFLGSDVDLATVEARAAKYWSYPPSALYPDVIPCLEALEGRFRLGVIANQPSSVRGAMEREGLTRFFEVWGVSDDLGLQKPDPALFARVLATAGVPPARTVMLGDRLDYDVRPAKTAGMRAIWVLRGEAPDEPTADQVAEPDATVRSLAEVPEVVESWATRRRILIIGGGFAGMYAAMRMEPLAKAGHTISLVSSENFMQYQPFLPEVASGTIDPRAAVVPLRPILRHVDVSVGEVVGLDHDARRATVRTVDGPDVSVDYDIVVVTAGSWSRVLPVPGLAERGIGFKTVQEAIYLRNHVLSRLDIAADTEDPARARSALTFVFVGAGYAGVEALGELEDLARDAIANYPMLRPSQMLWVLVEAGGQILPELPPNLATYAQERLEHRKIEVLLHTRLESIEGGVARLSDGRSFPADTLVWTAGVKPAPIASFSGLPLDEHGRILVDDRLRVVGVSDAWAAGDVAAVPDSPPVGSRPPPPSTRCVRASGWVTISPHRYWVERQDRSYGGTWVVCARWGDTRAWRMSSV